MEGVIVLSACLGSQIDQMILNNTNQNEIDRIALLYKNTFEDYYLEMQSATTEEQIKANKVLADMSDRLQIPLVVSSDVHFLEEKDFEYHGIFIKVSKDTSNEYYKDCYLKSEKEIMDIIIEQVGLEKSMEAVENTHKIADMCNVELELGKSYLPDFPIPKEFQTDIEYMHYLCEDGFQTRGLNDLNDIDSIIEYRMRFDEEFNVITTKNYTGYFLIVQDFLRECRENNIYTGDGRGSASGSLICFLLGITNVDPIKYNLSFARFLTMERVELPDIDNDLQSSKKSESLNILRKKYGNENIAQIGNIMTMQSKSCIDKIGKVLGISYEETKNIGKNIPDGMTIKEALDKSTKLVEYKQKYPKLFEYAEKLEGLATGMSTHAGGVCVCPSTKEMSDFTALAVSDEVVITQLEMKGCEKAGLVKMDMLATATLDVIDDCLTLIYGGELDG